MIDHSCQIVTLYMENDVMGYFFNGSWQSRRGTRVLIKATEVGRGEGNRVE